MKNVSLMIQCCAKLHNICVERWLESGRRNGFDNNTELEVVPEHVNVDIPIPPTDEEVRTRLSNRYTGIGVRAANNDLRSSMMNMIWDTGLRITCEADLIGLPSVEEEERVDD